MPIIEMDMKKEIDKIILGTPSKRKLRRLPSYMMNSFSCTDYIDPLVLVARVNDLVFHYGNS